MSFYVFGGKKFGEAPFAGRGESSHRTPIALLGDSSDHGGSLVSTNQDGTVKVNGIVVCVQGCSHSCPIPEHGTTSVTAITTRSYINGKLIITRGAVAGCGATITPPNRGVYVE